MSRSSRRLRPAALVWLCVAVCVSAVAAWHPIFAWWISAQLIKALWPLPADGTVERIQGWAWSRWEAEVASRSVEPMALPEVPIGQQPPAGLSKPFVVRGLLNGSLLSGDVGWLTSDLVGNIVVDYFTNASLEMAVVPDARATLREVVQRIMAGGPEKIGTEMIFRQHPQLLEMLLGERAAHVAELLGGHSHIRPARIGTTLTVPVFMARGAPRQRTDLHCEPIGNLMLMLKGRKTWTLVGPDQSRYLRPTLSPDGRAYFFSQQPTADPTVTLRHVARWVGETAEGDALWVPSWTWHRVDYTAAGEVALSASLFHFRAEQFLRTHPLYTALVVPNIVKELVGWKTQ